MIAKKKCFHATLGSGVRDFDNSIDPTRIDKLTAIIGPELFFTNGSAFTYIGRDLRLN